MRVELVTIPPTPTPPIVTVAPGTNWLPTRLTAVPPPAGPEVPEAYASWNDVPLVAPRAIPPDSNPRLARTAAARAAPLATSEEKGVRGEGLSLIGICPFSLPPGTIDFSGGRNCSGR